MTTGGHDETFRHTMVISYRHDDGNGVVQEVLGLELNEHRLGQVQPTYRVKDIGRSNIVKHRPQSYADVTLSFTSESYQSLPYRIVPTTDDPVPSLQRDSFLLV